MPESFPLAWPLGKPRTARPRRAQFSTSPADARDGLLSELRRLGARNVVVSSNVATYRRGGREVMYADQSAAKGDPGVAVYFDKGGDSFAFACDRWDRVQDNVQAIRKTVEALRGLDRWGTGDMQTAAFSGFAALPAAGQGSGRAWWEVLGVAPEAPGATVKAAYRRLLKVSHPAVPTGSREAYDEIQEAYLQAVSARQSA